jgi:hypothetical protein
MLDCHMSFYSVSNLASHISLKLLVIYEGIADMAYSGERMACLTVSQNASLRDTVSAIQLCMLFLSRVEVFLFH